MRLQEVDFTNFTENQLIGIKKFKISNLGTVVAIAGRNGAGKSRFIKAVREKLVDSIQYLNKPFEAIHFSTKDRSEILFKPMLASNLHIHTRQGIEDLIRKNPQIADIFDLALFKELFIEQLNRIPFAQIKIKEKEGLVETNKVHRRELIERIKKNVPNRLVEIKVLDLKNINFTDPSKKIEGAYSFNLIHKGKWLIEGEKISEITALHSHAFNYFLTLPHHLAQEKMLCAGNDSLFETKESKKEFEKLRGFIKIFLDLELAWSQKPPILNTSNTISTISLEGNWVLDGRPFDINELSDGQKLLFAYSLLFFLLDQNPAAPIRESVLFLDEPELHLHPESQGLLIRKIREVIHENGQLWIATHSINILAELSFNEIIVVKENEVIDLKSLKNQQKTPSELAIEELIGPHENFVKFSNFVLDVSNWSHLNFITECLDNPGIINSAKENDPQVSALKSALEHNKIEGAFLDFGAGTGRLFQSLYEGGHLNKVKYTPFEPNSEIAYQLKKRTNTEPISDLKDLKNESFDVVLLCNVLHEIKISELEVTLRKIINCIKQEGFLIIIEDLELSKGEKIGNEGFFNEGFLVLNKEDLEILFRMNIVPGQIEMGDEKLAKRILCLVFKRNEINVPDVEDIKKAIKSSQTTSYNKILEVRKDQDQKSKSKNGQLSAFYSQQFINAKIKLDFTAVQNDLIRFE
jgi:ABC-type cobalamin/Fe3+-siderophores transport system ATPase subunit/SAM-dependent methyltransferase